MFEKLQDALGYKFNNEALLKSALDRRDPAVSGFGSADSGVPCFEHLEFLGDRVLNLCITTSLSQLHPDWLPGQLSAAYIHYTRNADESAAHGGPLYRIAKELDLEACLTLNPGESLDLHGARGKKVKDYKTHKTHKTREGHLSDHMEALFGALYVDVKYSFSEVMPVVHRLFAPLGLLSADHASVSGFGASASETVVSAVDEEVAELVANGQRFLEMVSAGHLEELAAAGLEVVPEVAEQAFWVAITNGRVNVIPYLVKFYKIELEVIDEALSNDPDLPLDIKNFLIRYLAEEKIAASGGGARGGAGDGPVIEDKVEGVSEVDDHLFLHLAVAGNHIALMSSNLSVSAEVAYQGLVLAIRNRKVNIPSYIVSRYSISADQIQKILDEETAMLPAIRGFLSKKLVELRRKAEGGGAYGGATLPPCPWLTMVSRIDYVRDSRATHFEM